MVDQEGRGGQMRQRQGEALVGMLGTKPREGSGSQLGDGGGKGGWCLSREMGVAREVGISPGTEVRRSKSSQ